MSRDQNAGRNHGIRIFNKSFEKVEQFKYLETTLGHQNSIQEEIKCRYRTIILPVVLYRCETRSLTLMKERRLRVSENRALRRIFGPKRDEVRRERRKLNNEELNDLYSSPNVFG